MHPVLHLGNKACHLLYLINHAYHSFMSFSIIPFSVNLILKVCSQKNYITAIN
jgi:hypothetical protein